MTTRGSSLLAKLKGKAHSQVRRIQAGFTLIELMVVVVIMGVLAALGTAGFRSHLARAKNSEALAQIRSIAAAEEEFRGVHGQYISTTADLITYYPTAAPDGTKRQFWGHAGEARWRSLAPRIAGLTSFGFAAIAGLPGAMWPTTSTATVPNWPAGNTEPWYAIQAIGDDDGDGTMNLIFVTSFNDRIYQEGPGE